jgi:DNA-binding NarL/FixJ family response regulator
MRKRRVLLLCAQQLLGESLEHTLRQVEDLEVAGPWTIEEGVLNCLSGEQPDLVIITDEDIAPEKLSRLTAQILEQYPDLPVFRVTLERNLMQVYSSHTMPARSADLIDLIHRLPVRGKGYDQE